MKHHLIISKALISAAALVLFAACVFWAPRSTATTTPPASRQDEKGTIVAQLKDYDPTVHGYGFRNYGRYEGLENSLDAGDLIKLFGAENVCESGTTAQDCVLYEPAEEWLEQQFKMLANGHCDGLAITSLRFWLGMPFDGKGSPGDWQSGAESVFNLQRSEVLENYVANVHVKQALAEIFTVRRTLIKNKPSGILRLLIDSMKNGNDRYELLIYKFDEGRLTKGHAILPYAVEDMGDGDYRIHCYDSNFQGKSKYVELNTKEENWRYHTAANPEQTASDYVGDASTGSITLQNLAARELDQYGCPFCPDTDRASRHHASGARKTPKDQVGFTFTGEGEYIITDPNGKRIGYDFGSKRFVNEIPEADVVAYTGGLDKNVPAQYHLPRLRTAAKPYSITVGGKGINQEVVADLEMTGPGFLVGFEGVLLDPGETMMMTISPNGRELSFTASQDGETPNVFITIATGHKDPSYEFNIGGIRLAAGKTVSMKLDLEKQKLYFKDNDSDRDPYDVYVTRVNPDGTEDYYENIDMDMAKKSDNFEMDFGKWDGKGPMCFEEDDEGNGFEDDECDEEPNEKKPAKPPAKPPAAINYFRRTEPIAALLWY